MFVKEVTSFAGSRAIVLLRVYRRLDTFDMARSTPLAANSLKPSVLRLFVDSFKNTIHGLIAYWRIEFSFLIHGTGERFQTIQ
jgi:hypothetical protein